MCFWPTLLLIYVNIIFVALHDRFYLFIYLLKDFHLFFKTYCWPRQWLFPTLSLLHILLFANIKHYLQNIYLKYLKNHKEDKTIWPYLLIFKAISINIEHLLVLIDWFREFDAQKFLSVCTVDVLWRGQGKETPFLSQMMK